MKIIKNSLFHKSIGRSNMTERNHYLSECQPTIRRVPMDRRSFLQNSIGTLVAGNAALQGCRTTPGAPSAAVLAALNQILPRQIRVNVKPVMTNIIHTDVWEGPCRFNVQPPSEEMAAAQKRFNKWAADIKTCRKARYPQGLGDYPFGYFSDQSMCYFSNLHISTVISSAAIHSACQSRNSTLQPSLCRALATRLPSVMS